MISAKWLALSCLSAVCLSLAEARVSDGRNSKESSRRSNPFERVGAKESQVARAMVKDFERDFGAVVLFKPVCYKRRVTEITEYTFKVRVAKARRQRPDWVLIEAQASVPGRVDYKGYKPIDPENEGYHYKSREPYRYDYDTDDDDDDDDDTDDDYSDDNTDLDTTDDENCPCGTDDDDDSSDDETSDDEC